MLMPVVLFLLAACEKTGERVSMDDVEDENLTEMLFEDVFASIDEAETAVDGMLFSGLKSLETSDCPVITVDRPDTLRWPKVMTIDYGEACIKYAGDHTITRSGKIVITFTGRFRKPGATRTVTMVDYYINGIRVEGVKTIVNTGRNTNGNLEFSVVLSGGKVILPDSTVATREVTRTREWIGGELTPSPWDDQYLVTGNAGGITFSGLEYTRVITTPLSIDRACRFITSGIVEITTGDNPAVILDYGDGTCDALASVTIDGVTREIILRHNHRRFPG